MKSKEFDLEEMPDSELFLRDTEAWYKRRHPDWSEVEIEGVLREIRFLSLLEFYEYATQYHPELVQSFHLLPAKPYSGYFALNSPDLTGNLPQGS